MLLQRVPAPAGTAVSGGGQSAPVEEGAAGDAGTSIVNDTIEKRGATVGSIHMNGVPMTREV